MGSDYRLWEVDVNRTQGQFQETVDHIKSQGYVIPGVVTDYANSKVIIIARKPTAAEMDEQAKPRVWGPVNSDGS